MTCRFHQRIGSADDEIGVENGLLNLFVGALAIDVGKRVGGLFAAANRQHLDRLPLQRRVPLAARHLAEQRLRLRRLILRQNKQRAGLELLGFVAVKDLLNDRQRARFILLHERVQGKQLELFILLGLGWQRIVALAADLDFQRAALVDPIAVRVSLP